MEQPRMDGTTINNYNFKTKEMYIERKINRKAIVTTERGKFENFSFTSEFCVLND